MDGCAAAIAAAHSGAKTALIEQNGYLGGATVAQMASVILSTNGVDFQGMWHDYANKLNQYGGLSGIRKAPNPLLSRFQLAAWHG